MASSILGLRFEKLPDLGRTDPEYSVVLSEAEINSIYALYGFCKGACDTMGNSTPAVITDWIHHYGPTLEKLTLRLSEEFDDK